MLKNKVRKRLPYLDIAKGILIICVVLGHSKTNAHLFLYWFHMPAFYIISGLLHNQPENAPPKPFIFKKSLALLKPYLAFATSVIIISVLFDFFTQHISPVRPIAVNIFKIIYSGKLLFGAMSPFWFVPNLLLTIISFTLLRYFVPKAWIPFFLIVSFVAGIILGKFSFPPLPWNINGVPISLFYYGAGFYGKNSVNKIRAANGRFVLFIILLLVCTSLIIAAQFGYFSFMLDMKYSKYSNPVLAIIIPILFTLFILVFSMLLESNRVAPLLEYIGINSLIIMYLHFPVDNAIMAITKNYIGDFMFVIFGVSIPLLIGFILEKFSFTRNLFFGRGDIKSQFRFLSKPNIV